MKAKVKYYEYLKSPQWKKIRQAVLKRDGNKCCICGSYTHLQVHHLSYVSLGNESLDDLITVCKTCHSKRLHHIKEPDETIGERWERIFGTKYNK